MTRDAATLSSHVLDLESGRPASGLAIALLPAAGSAPLARAVTDDDGRVATWEPALTLVPGLYRLLFATGDWFAGRGRETFYPEVSVSFRVLAGGEHYHVPLLLSAYGYSTYRGS
jgi:5-hydroxyisourate hydrolase